MAKKKPILSTYLFPVAASISVLIVALSVAYYLMIFLPNKQKTEQLIQQEKTLGETSQKEEEKDIFAECDKTAREKARDLLKDKIEIAKKSNLPMPSTWEAAYEQGNVIKDDYETYYNNCLRAKGVKY